MEVLCVNPRPLCSVHRLSSVPCGHWHPCSKKEAHSVGLRRWMLPSKLCMHVVPPWVYTCWRSCLTSASTEGLERWKRMSRTCWEGHKEECEGEWTTPAPKFTATSPEVADESEGAGTAALPSGSCRRWETSATSVDWPAALTAWVTERVGTATEWS